MSGELSCTVAGEFPNTNEQKVSFELADIEITNTTRIKQILMQSKIVGEIMPPQETEL